MPQLRPPKIQIPLGSIKSRQSGEDQQAAMLRARIRHTSKKDRTAEAVAKAHQSNTQGLLRVLAGLGDVVADRFQFGVQAA